jgi:hypothetical protein
MTDDRMLVKNLEVILVLIYAIPSILLYIVIIYVVLNKDGRKVFHSSFYKLFVINGIL